MPVLLAYTAFEEKQKGRRHNADGLRWAPAAGLEPATF